MRLVLSYILAAYLLYEGAFWWASIWGWWIGLLYSLAACVWPAYEWHRMFKHKIHSREEKDEGTYEARDLEE